MAPPRKSVSRGKSEREDDPERRNRTVPKAKNPLVVDDPERDQPTNARARIPPRVLPSKRRGPQVEEEEYRTGPSYAAMELEAPTPSEVPDEALAGSQLEGEGLDALDPEVGSHTQSLKAHEPDEADEADAGADHQGADDGVEDTNATRAGPPIKLEIFSGPDAGRKRRFNGVRMVIGRIPGVDIRLKDQSVSRRHVELVQGDGGVLLRDLGSGNGTKVNGAKVAEKTLEHGDEIHLGRTKIRFVDEVAAFQKANEEAEKQEAEEKAKAEQAAADEAPKEEASPDGPKAEKRPVREGRRRGLGTAWERLSPRLRITAIGLGIAVAAIVAAGILLRSPPAPQIDPAKAAAEQKMQDARAAVRAADYGTAVALIEGAEKLVPGIDRSKLGNQAREELALTRALDEARGHITARRFEDAKRVLDKAPAGSNKNEEVKVQLRSDLEAAEVAYKKEQLGEFLAGGELEAAKAVLGELPVDQQADSARKIAAFERHAAEQKKEDAQHRAQQVAGASARRKAEREEELLAAFSIVERKFAGGEWERAASECSRVIDQAGDDQELKDRARLLQTAMPSFGRAYDEGTKKYRQGTLALAAKPLRQALELLTKAQLKRNKYQNELETKLGEASLAAGREALLRDDLVVAYQAFRDAARFDPSEAKAREGLSNVEAKAQELFQLAYTERDSDPTGALKRFRVVVQSTDASSLVHEKAKNHIAAMAP